MSFSEKYRLQYQNDLGETIRWDILLDGFSGSVTNIIGSGDPVRVRFDKSGDEIFEAIKPSSHSIQFVGNSITDFAEFHDITDRQYLAKKYVNNVLAWQGFVAAELFSQDVVNGINLSEITAHDGLGDLANIEYTISGRKTHLQIIAEILAQTGHSLNICVAVNIWESRQNTSLSPTAQTYIDTEIFRKDERYSKTCLEVLRDILETYTARIAQQNGKWVISRIDDMYDGTVSGFEFDYLGQSVGAYSASNLKTIGNSVSPSSVQLLEGGKMQKNRAYKHFEIKQDFGVKEKSIVKNGTFDFWENDTTLKNWSKSEHVVIEKKILSNGNSVVAIKVNAFYDKTYIETIISGLESDSESKFIFSFDCGELYFFENYTARLYASLRCGNNYYLKKDDDDKWIWTTEISYIQIDGLKSIKDILNLNLSSFTLEIDGYPASEPLTIRLYAPEKHYFTNYPHYAIFDNINFYAKNENIESGVLFIKGENNSNFNFVPDAVEIKQCDIPDIANNTVIYKNYLSLDSDGAQPTIDWQINGTGSAYLLSEHRVRSVCNARSKNTVVFRGQIQGNINPLSVFTDYNRRRLIITSFDGSEREGIYTIEAVELIEPGTASITVTQDEYTSDPKNSSSGGSSSSNSEKTPTDKKVSVLGPEGLEIVAAGHLSSKYYEKQDLVSSKIRIKPKDRLINRNYIDDGTTDDPVATGENAVAIGIGNEAANFGEVVVGKYATISEGSPDTFVETDRAFAVGVGTGVDARAVGFEVFNDKSAKIHGNATISGDLTVMGNLVYLDVETVRIKDNIGVINYGETGAGITAGFAGWEADRGTLDNYRWGFDETRDRWVLGEVDTTLQAVATIVDNPTDQSVVYFDATDHILKSTSVTKTMVETHLADVASYAAKSVTTGTGQILNTFASDAMGHVTGITLRSLADGDIPGTIARTSQLHSEVTLGTANGLSLNGQELSLGLASTSTNGALSSTDWDAFNSKQAAYTNLTSIGSLANAAGWLKNNGSGSFSYTTPSYSDVGAAPASGSANYIQNQNAAAQSANMWLDGNAKASTLQSTVATGTAPLIVASTTLVNNLNAEYLGGHNAAYFQPLLTNPITGTGASGQVSFWDGTSTQTGNNGLFWNNTDKMLGIGTTSPGAKLDVCSTGAHYIGTPSVLIQDNSARATMRLRSLTNNPSELFFDVNGAIRWDISARNSSGNYDLNFYPQAGTPRYTSVGPVVMVLSQTGNLSLSGTIQATTGKFTDLTDNYIVKHISDASGLGNSIIYDNGTNVGIGTTTNINSKLTFASSTTAAGGILFGSDVNLYRSATNVLKTDDTFEAPILKMTTGAAAGYLPVSSADGIMSWTAKSSINLADFNNNLGNYGGFLTSETDPIYTASSWYSTTNNASDWNSAYSFTSGFATNYPDLTAIEAITGTSGLLKKTAANTWTLDTNTYITGISGSDVTTALGFTPYNSTNPAGYITSSSLSGYATESWVSTNYDNYDSWYLYINDSFDSYMQASSSLNMKAGTGISITSGGYGNITISASGSMVYPGEGIAVSTGSEWGTSITDNSSSWNSAASWVATNGANAVTAYGWGNHASAGYAAASHNHSGVYEPAISKSGSGYAYWNGSAWSFSTPGGGGTPGGSSGAIQYNNAGAFGGFGSWNGSTLTVGGALSASSGSYSGPVNAEYFGMTDSGGDFWTMNVSSGLSITREGNVLFQVSGSGNCTAVGSFTATNHLLSGSDIRLKTNIDVFRPDNWVENIILKEFSFKNDLNRKRYGVIAQELELIAPEMVVTGEDGIKYVSYTDVLVAKISWLENKVKELEQRLK